MIGIDNLSRAGSNFNAEELVSSSPSFTLHKINLSHTSEVYELFSTLGAVDAVFHLAGQVAVTTSYSNRENDFLNNLLASFNVIEAIKQYTPEAYCLYASTNKVYGKINFHHPVGKETPLNPYTPYGVSKAGAELYFTEYGREEIGLSTCSLRQSCIYGHHQYGVEAQGWIAWFSIANILGLPVTIYGDGQQVRDLLFVEDLVDLYLECLENRVTGTYPIGGGFGNHLNLRQALDLISTITQKPFVSVKKHQMRPGDQPYFVADTSWTREIGLRWAPTTNHVQGVGSMVQWIQAHQKQIAHILHA